MGTNAPHHRAADGDLASSDRVRQLTDELDAALQICRRMIARNIETIREVEAIWGQFLSEAETTEASHRPGIEESVFPLLTEQESRVLEQICHGRTNRQIARRLGISEKTAKNYVQAVFRKLQVHSRTEAAIMATRHRWYEAPVQDKAAVPRLDRSGTEDG